MRCLTRVQDGVTVCRVSGLLTVSESGGALEREVRSAFDQGVRRMVVDLSGVDMMDSSGLGELSAAHRLLRDAGGHLAVAGMSDRVQKVMDLAGLSGKIPLFGHADAAVTSLRG